jgi:hypothetical protein
LELMLINVIFNSTHFSFISVAYSANEKGESRSELLGPGPEKGGCVARIGCKIFFFLGSIIVCRMYKLTFSNQVQPTYNWESVFRI